MDIINIPEETKHCAICLSILNEEIEELSCSHSFHKDCINLWNHNNNTCPLCRCIIKNTQINQQDENNFPYYNYYCDIQICCAIIYIFMIVVTIIVLLILFTKKLI